MSQPPFEKGALAGPKERMRLLKLIPDHTKIDFVGARFYAFGFDGLLTVIALVSLIVIGLNFGIDFTGGVLVEVKATQSIDIGAMRTKVDSLGFPEAQLQYFGGGECEMPPNSCVLIRVQPQMNTASSDQEVVNKVRGVFGGRLRVPPHGGGWAQGLRRAEECRHPRHGYRGLMIGIYVAVRFEWQYGVAAIIATGHDVFVTAGFIPFCTWIFRCRRSQPSLRSPAIR
jgi:preprotein translocase subunit SecF